MMETRVDLMTQVTVINMMIGCKLPAPGSDMVYNVASQAMYHNRN